MKLAAFDIESTGLDTTQDRIVEITVSLYEDYRELESVTKRVNPGIPIPKEASDIHGITDDLIKDCPIFKDVVLELASVFYKADAIIGFNSLKFDMPILSNELGRCNMSSVVEKLIEKPHIDVGNLYKINNPRTLGAAYKQYTGNDLEDAHTAKADVDATAIVLQKMIGDIEDASKLALESNYGRETVDIDQKFTVIDGEYCFNFSKHAGKPVKDNLGMLYWMLDRDFSENTKSWASKLIDKFNSQTEFKFRKT